MMPAKRCSQWRFLLSLLFLSFLPVQAQVSASLSGRVTDQTGAAVTGASVAVTNVDTGLTRSTITDQVANGVSIRMAVLYLLLGGSEPAIGLDQEGAAR